MSPPSSKEAGMQMSERQWQVLSLLERLDRGEVTLGEVAASRGRSKRQGQRMPKRVAGKGAAGLVHGNGSTAYSTTANASHGRAAYGQSLQHAATRTTTRTNHVGVTFPRSS